MIFVGDGALLQQAINTALEGAYRVEGVLGNTDQLQSFCAQRNIPFERTRKILTIPSWVKERCSDGVGFSIDNSILLPAQFLEESGIEFFGIHSGIIPLQRGNPIVASMFAILEGQQEYGVSLFKLDGGVDTGEVLTIRRFPLTPHLRLHELILRCAQLCQEVFEEFVGRIVRRRYEVQPPASPGRPSYQLRDLEKLRYFQDCEAFDRATDFGLLLDVLPERYLQRICELRRSRQLLCVAPSRESEHSRALQFWLQQTESVPTLGPPLIATGSPTDVEVRSSYSFSIGTEAADAIRTFSEVTESSSKHVLLACLLVLLARYSGNRDMCVGASRSDSADAKCPVWPIRVRLETSQNFTELVRKVVQCLQEAEAQLDALTRDDFLRMPRSEEETMFETAFVEAPGVTRHPVAPPNIADWLWSYEVREGDFRVSILPRHAQPDLVERLATHYSHLLVRLLSSPRESVFSLDLLTDRELQSLRVDWSQAGFPEFSCASVTELIEHRISTNPAATAVIDVDGSALTYAELSEAANKLAHWIGADASSQMATVAIVLSRRSHVITAMLASWKARRAFVPLDPALPRERLQGILRDCNATIVVCESAAVSSLPALDHRLIVIDASKPAGDSPGDRLPAPKWAGGGRELAYVIYTSGSTGSPKGVMVEHRALAAAFDGTQLAYPLHPGDRVLGLGGLGSDAALWQFIGPLCWGSTVIFTQNTADPRSILRTICDCAVTIVDLVPSLLHALVSELREWLPQLTTLRAVISGGESLPFNLLMKLMEAIPHCDVINAYGPTEACCQVTFHRCSAERPVSIGKPIPHTQLYVLSPEGKAVPPGVAGEIYIGGSTLAQGYLQRPTLTAQKFVCDSFMPDPTARMYRTGDIGRVLDSGGIEFLGRVDNQVKVRGHRVELGEIENALRECTDVSDALVVHEHRGALSARLIAYVIGTTPLNAQAVTTHLRSKLPSHMVPAFIVPLASWPLTQQQKIDRDALAHLQGDVVRISPELVPPRSDIEASLLEMWKEVLGIQEIGIRDHFLDLGGHSLLAVQLLTEIRNQFGVNLPLRSMSELSTVERMARFILGGQSESVDAQQTKRALLLADSELPEGIRIQCTRNAFTPSDVLLTGASGYLGRHLLRLLLEHTTSEIYCLVRQRTVDSADRFTATHLSGNRRRIHVVHGDLSAPDLGLSSDARSMLLERVGAIFHAGAWVNHIAPYQALRSANVGGTLELLRLATTGAMKEFHFVSSIDVLGGSASETLLLGGPSEGMQGYAASKWVSDQLVAKATLRGVSASIYRVGYLGPSSDGSDANGSGWAELYISAMFKLGLTPNGSWSIPLTPVDLVAESICRLYERGLARNRAFHLVHRERHITRETIIAAAKVLGARMETVPRPVWRARLKAHCTAHPAEPISLLGPYFDSTDENGPLSTQSFAPTGAEETRKLLYAVGDFEPAILVARFVQSRFAPADAGHARERTA